MATAGRTRSASFLGINNVWWAVLGGLLPRRSTAKPLDTRQQQLWEAQTEEIPNGKQVRVRQNHSPLSFRQLFSLLENDAGFRVWYTQAINRFNLDAFFWEHPSFSTETFDCDAEFVLVGASSLAKLRPDPAPFASQFADDTDADVITFPNLLGDAILIVPRPIGPPEAYPHLAAFLRLAPDSQIESLWQCTARAVREQLGPKPRWLSTAGLGVAWLHLRLDTRPKYFRFRPYTAAVQQAIVIGVNS